MDGENTQISSTTLWKNRNFLLLWSGQFVSWAGTEISGIALPLIALALTRSPAQAGFLAGIRGLVYIVWAIPAGLFIDRWDRRMVMVIANVGSGLAMGSISIALLLRHLTVAQLYIAGVIEGSFFVFANLSRFAAIPRVVTQEQVPAASAQTNVVNYTALLLGPAIGGFIYQTIGAMSAFFLDALSYFINALAIFFIDVPLQIERGKTETTFIDEVREGMLWLWKHSTIRFINVLTAGGTMMTAGLYLLIIILARNHNASSGAIGLILASGAAGGIVSSLGAGWVQKHVRFHAILKATTILSFLIFLFYFIAATNIALALITAALNGVTSVYEVTVFSYSASVIPDRIRGRVSSLTRLVVLGSYSLGFFVMGWLLQLFGAAWAISIFSCVLFGLALITVLNRHLRNI